MKVVSSRCLGRETRTPELDLVSIRQMEDSMVTGGFYVARNGYLQVLTIPHGAA
jgi:hypothetical protein